MLLVMGQSAVQIFPSLLSADFGALAQEAVRVEEAGGDGLHVDIMDGHFVPNLTLGPRALHAVRRATSLFLDVHLMIDRPMAFIENFAVAGADQITFHFESSGPVKETIRSIRSFGKKVGLAFRPETSRSVIPEYIPLCDQILIMTVSPGFGGQSFLRAELDKVRWTRQWASEQRSPLKIEVDGGINAETAQWAIAAGADVLVSGSYLFSQLDLKKAIASLRGGLG